MKTIYIIYYSLLVLMLFLCAACSTSKKVQDVTDNNTEKTIEKIVVYKDTILYAPYAKADLIFPKAVLKTGTDWIYKSQNNQATVLIKAINDTIYVTASCDSLKMVAKIKQEYNTLIENNNRSRSTITHQKTASWSTSLAVFFTGLVVGIIIALVGRLLIKIYM